jgi:orotate phosphoribosyltransferase
MPDSISLLIDAGDCVVVDASTDHEQVRDHLGRFISDTLIDSTVGANGQNEYHFITPGGSHIPTWYRLGPLLELEGVADLIAFHLAMELRSKSIDIIIPWAEPGIQLAIRLASSLSAGADERVGYVVLVKDSLSGGQPEISDLDEASISGKRVLVLTDVLCAGETIRKLSDEVTRLAGYVGAVAGILNFGRSAQLSNALDSIASQNNRQLVAWTREKTSTLPRPPEFDGAHWLCEVLDPVIQMLLNVGNAGPESLTRCCGVHMPAG